MQISGMHFNGFAIQFLAELNINLSFVDLWFRSSSLFCFSYQRSIVDENESNLEENGLNSNGFRCTINCVECAIITVNHVHKIVR